MPRQTIAIVTIEGIFREDLVAVAETPEEAITAARREYLRIRKSYRLQRGETDWYTFDEAAEYFGIRIQVVTLGSAWHGSDEGYLDPSDFGFDC
jgi:hypothetical protein